MTRIMQQIADKIRIRLATDQAILAIHDDELLSLCSNAMDAITLEDWARLHGLADLLVQWIEQNARDDHDLSDTVTLLLFFLDYVENGGSEELLLQEFGNGE